MCSVGQRGEAARTGPMMVACQLNKLSPVGPAEHDDGGSRPRSRSSSARTWEGEDANEWRLLETDACAERVSAAGESESKRGTHC